MNTFELALHIQLTNGCNWCHCKSSPSRLAYLTHLSSYWRQYYWRRRRHSDQWGCRYWCAPGQNYPEYWCHWVTSCSDCQSAVTPMATADWQVRPECLNCAMIMQWWCWVFLSRPVAVRVPACQPTAARMFGMRERNNTKWCSIHCTQVLYIGDLWNNEYCLWFATCEVGAAGADDTANNSPSSSMLLFAADVAPPAKVTVYMKVKF